ncbi:alpha/beta hydrolase [Caulobacter sp. 17J65-9]|uniref:alpha/beta hydrolase n=1 Tax=Caulobacter sp. 17J65-9 TaxID=2709382 RepID=UPI0013C5DB0B|nr:alpha/beta hydrolase [Caulobacter sp. 17J65-9]NEX92209.1 alpha/beta hydrolase [Caulobacter sp. 17J65-9]
MSDPTRRVALALLAAPLLAAAPAGGPVEIAYGADRSQRLDVYPRPGLRNAPVILYVHGGGWAHGDKRMVNALPDYAQRNGFLLLSVGYRLAPEVNARGCAEDVAAATAWARAHVREYGGDPHKLFLVGHSAGAHLVALVGVDPTYLGAHKLTPADLAGVVPLDGAGYDAPRQMATVRPRGPLGQMYAEAFGDEAAALSPTLLAAKGRSYPPFLIFHVAAREDSGEQSRALAEALRQAGGRAEAVSAPGETHRSINTSFGLTGDPEGERAARFLRTGAL